MEIKPGANKTYSCRFWYYRNGKKYSKYRSGFTKKKDARDWGNAEKAKLERLENGDSKATVRTYLDRWMKMKEKKLSPTTVSGYKVNIKHINNHIGDIPLEKLMLLDIQDMADALSEQGLKYRTVKYVCRVLHAALEYAVINRTIDYNPCKGVDIVPDEEAFEVQIYNVDDLRKMLTLLKEQEHPLYIPVLLASMRGLRRGEALGLRWMDIDFAKEIMYIRNNYVKVEGIYYDRPVKTKDSVRFTSIAGFVQDELQARKDQLHKTGRIPTFVCEIDGQRPDPSHISRQLTQFQTANGFPICRFHDLRHTFAVLQLENGTDLDTLKNLMGHSKIGITSDLYLHPNVTLIKKATTNLDNVITMQNTEKDKENEKKG